MEKVTFIYQLLPGEKVKIFSPKRQAACSTTTKVFEELKNDPKMSRVVQWMEYKQGDLGSHFQTDTLTMDLVNVDGVRVLHVKDKQA